MLVKVLQWTTVCSFVTLTVLPLLYAIARLEAVTGINSVVAVGNFFTTKASLEALKFTLLEASISTIATVIIGLPIAWCLGRYNWKNIKFLRAILAVPFVTPSIADGEVKELAPLAALLLVTTYFKITMLLSDNALLTTPSPK